MVKPPKIRHSKPRRDPVTIDLDPADVKRGSGKEESSAEAGKKVSESSSHREAGKAEERTAASGTSTADPAKSNAVAAEPASPTSEKDEKGPSAKSEQGTGSAQAKNAKNEKPAASAPAGAAASSTGTAKEDGKRADQSESRPAAAAGATTSVPASGKTDPVKPAGPGAGSTVPPKPVGGTKEQPPYGRGAASGSGTTDRKDAPSPSAPVANAGSSRRSGASAVFAGLIGAVIALLGVGALQYAGVLPGLERGGGSEAEVAELRSQIDSLREEVAAAVADDGAGAGTARVEELASSVEEIRTEIARLQSAGPAGESGDTEALQGRLTELESTVASLQNAGTGASSEQVSALQDRIAGLETQVTNASDAATAAQGAISGLQERLASLDTRLQELSEQVETQASDPGAALAIAAAGLKAAIDRGDPFMTELETFAAVAPEAPEIAALRELAASGVPTRAAIAGRVDEVAARMIAAADPADENAGYLDQLLDSVGSLVTVRPIGEVEGEGVGPTVARMEAAIEAGNYERAIAEYETLPEPVQAAGDELIADVRARQSADDLIAKALAGALRA